MLGSMTYEASPHPLLDLTPMEQVVLLKAARSELRTSVVSLTEAPSLRHLERLELVEPQGDYWMPTPGRGDLVGELLRKLERVRTVRRSQAALEKKAAIYVETQETIDALLSEIRRLAV